MFLFMYKYTYINKHRMKCSVIDATEIPSDVVTKDTINFALKYVRGFLCIEDILDGAKYNEVEITPLGWFKYDF